MSNIKTIEGSYTGASAQYVVVITRWNSFVVDSLLKGALDALGRHGVAEKDITIVKVPGAFELPLAVQKISQGSCDAIIALGAVIRGGTPHFEYATDLYIPFLDFPNSAQLYRFPRVTYS